ncbi:MAG: hypothetical protein RRA51_06520 [Armatimonadota bacterium]|nr:hypothetical protein [Armatimonadota bacterium]
MPSPKPLNLTDELQRKFPAEVLSVLQEVGKVASQMGMTAYAVGGFVRDLLLGTPTLDIDIVVEGNGIALAQKLAQMWQADLTVHERFLTATLQWRLKEPVSTIASTNACILSRLDIATARKERYPSPAALPEVEPASIFDDLWRRDFTINAMAICLDPTRFGELVDPTGGFGDLRRGIIRVLHERSFVDDPTRIFRAVRYEQRFDFKIEPKTLRLICQARDESFLAKLSRDRIKHELWRILQERDPTKPMRRLSKLRILSVIAPELCVTKERLEWMRKANEWLNWFAEKFPEKTLEREWALLLPLLPTYEAVNSFSQRYQLGESERECGLALLKALRRRTPKRPSGWVRWLNPLPLEAALVLAAKRSSPNDPAWQRYFLEWRWARPDITGEDLKTHGITGRAISIGLQAALAVKLDEGADARRQLEVALRRAQQCQTSRR